MSSRIAHASSPSSAAKASSETWSRSTRTTRRPLATAARAMARPMPPAAPVSRTTSPMSPSPLALIGYLQPYRQAIASDIGGLRRREEEPVEGQTEGSVSALLGAFVARSGMPPDAQRHQGKRALLNGFGTAL